MAEKEKAEDVLFMGPETGCEHGHRPYVRQTETGEIHVGIIRPIKDGEPIYDEAMQLEHKSGSIYNVHSVYKPPTSRSKSAVATESYRDGWDRLWGNKTAGQA